MPAAPRASAAAFLVATTTALVVDAALQLAMDAVRVSPSGGTPWWITANVIERGRWVIFAGLLWWLGPRLLAGEADPPVVAEADGAAHAWRRVGLAVGSVPLLWIIATWAVSAVRFTVLGSWATDGRVFVSTDYYRAILLDLAPWLLASAAVFAFSRHVE